MLAGNWARIAGLAFVAFAVLLLAGLMIAQIAGANVACGPLKPFIITIVSLCVGAAGGFLGGWATATGAIPLPNIPSPIQVSIGGGAALLIIVAVVMNYTFDCPDDGFTRRLNITDVEGVAKPGTNLTVKYEAIGWPAGSRLAIDYSTDKSFTDYEKGRTEYVNDIGLTTWTFRIHPSIPEGQGWVQLRVLDPQDNEIGKTKAPRSVKP
jgi:hypothetical protein